MFCSLGDSFYSGLMPSRRGRDIEKYKFVGTLCVVESRKLDGITCITEVHKVNPFYNPPILHVKAWDYTLCKHILTDVAHLVLVRSKLRFAHGAHLFHYLLFDLSSLGGHLFNFFGLFLEVFKAHIEIKVF